MGGVSTECVGHNASPAQLQQRTRRNVPHLKCANNTHNGTLIHAVPVPFTHDGSKDRRGALMDGGESLITNTSDERNVYSGGELHRPMRA